MAIEQQVTGGHETYFLDTPDFRLRLGQKLTISGRKVTKLAFTLRRLGTVTGDISFSIRAVDDDEVLNTKVLGDASTISTSATQYEVTFDTPVAINEEVRITADWPTAQKGASDYIKFTESSSDVKADEGWTKYQDSAWDDTKNGIWDATYKYTYSVASVVTTQTCDDVVGTTATGRGNITTVGDTITAHGHCVATSADPTTSSPIVVNNGATSSTGAYRSAITGLTAGTGYYTRAYSINAYGTSYGANVYFIASLDRAGYIGTPDSNLHFFDINAVERTTINTTDVDDTPVDSATTAPISSNWAYDMAVTVAAKDYGLSFEGVVTAATDNQHFKVSTLAGKGAGFFKPTAGEPYEIYVVQADGAAPEGQHQPVVAYTTGDGTFQHSAFTTNDLAVGDIVLVIHPWLARMLDLYTDWKDGGRLDSLVDAIITDIASAVPEGPTANSLQDILHKDSSYTYSKKTDSLEGISNEVDELHQHVYILFVIPEATGSITPDNTALLTELQKLGHVETITQGDALEFPAFGGYAIAVMGTENGAASWTTSNLADLKNILGLTLLCVDNVSAAYFQIGTGGTAASKTVIKAITEIEGTKMGLGENEHEIVTGLDAGDNTVTSSATYHTLNMANANITETVFCTENVAPDTGSANTDVTMGIIRWIQHDGTIGVDEDGNDIPATLAFAGFAYEGDKLTTLGKATFYLLCHMLIQLRIQEATVEAGGLVADLRKRIFGNMASSFGTTNPLVEYIAGENSTGSKLPSGVSLPDLVATRVMGRLQIATTTEDLNQAASTYDLFTGNTQAVRLVGLTVKMPTGAAGGSVTSIAIVTDDATAGTIISSTTGTVANLTSEADLSWTGSLKINVGTKIRLTLAGGAHGSEHLVTVTAEYRAVVSGGYLT